MSIILRKERFGGLIADTDSYDIRVVNGFTFDSFQSSVLKNGRLEISHINELNKVGFEIENKIIRVISEEIDDGSPMLSAPVILWFELTSSCPLKCKHCFINCGKSKNDINIPFEYVSKVLEEATEMGVVRVTLSGGEAFSYPYIEDVIKQVNRLGMGLRLFTNGIIKRSENEWLKKYRIDTVFISVDGTQEHHDNLRGKNTFVQINKSLGWLSKLENIRNITLSVTLDRYNARYFEGLLSLCELYGIKTILIRPLMGYEWTEDANKFVFTEKSELLAAIKNIEKFSSKYGIECQLNKIPIFPIDKNEYLEDHKNNSSIWNLLGNEDSIDCVGGNLVCGIRYDGVVSPC